MSEPIAFCPGCKQEVAFIWEGNMLKCPRCGFQFQIGTTSPPEEGSPKAISGLWLFVRFVLVVLAVVAIGIGVLFVGCVIAFKGIPK